MTAKDGETATLACDDLDDEGAATATFEGARVHVACALPGERVRATVTHVSSHRPEAWARLDEIEAPSPDRRAPACPAYGSCGGCVLQHLDVAAQRAWKEARVRRALVAHPVLAGVAVAPAVASPKDLGYRNRSKLVASGARGRLVLGAFAPRSHAVVDLTGCRIAEPPLDDVATALRAAADAAGVAPHDELTRVGDLRHVVLRANAEGQVHAILVTARAEVTGLDALVDALRTARPEVVGVVQNVNSSRGNVIFGHETRALAGVGTLEDRVGDVKLRLSPGAFFQANRDVAALAYAAIARAVDAHPGEAVVDAYGGVGGIALTLAQASGDRLDVLGIEEHAAATADATASAALNGITRARFVTGDVATCLRDVARADAVVLNPPRKGCDPAVLTEVARLRPRTIAYLSCDPDTLARDLAALVERGFAVEGVVPLDMMPHTPHVEALAILRR
ncbi:MAG TPA: 23S rRNA (uracil(1939)-C(5))-methyltransferase RlmD [Polyangia bacterium]|nr:23S rRNA (uracil(1939)-C(5))-methyltransferase RlmD [Polyangia bacterium]